MNTQITLENFNNLKLKGMSKVYNSVLSMSPHQLPGLHEFAARLTEAEIQEKNEKKTSMYLKTSKLRYNALLEHVYCNVQRNFTKDNLLQIADCSFIERTENVLITGATGCGKSYLACAMGRAACSLGYKTLYFGMPRLFEKITQAKLDGTYIKFINQLEKTNLIILDDFGLQPLTQDIRLTLLQILEDSYQKNSIIVTSQLPVSMWHQYIGDVTLADAILDRLVVNSSRIELKGDSLRKKK